LIVIASTRPGRVGLPVGKWFYERAVAHAGFRVELADLAELDLPFLDERHHPRLRKYEQQHTLEWSKTVSSADAFVLVMPEYNHGYTAPLKNAIDFLHEEWHHKPIGFVSYGGVAAGARAVQALKPVVTVLAMAPTVVAVNIPFVRQFVEDERFAPSDGMEQSATRMLNELAQLESALRPLRINAT
jgi:NAD(P)H-dependent FMN reductase